MQLSESRKESNLMGYAMCHAYCIGCRRLISFNPIRVPSITVNGVKEPLCECCVAILNTRRIDAGLKPVTIAADAYEPVDEIELYTFDDMPFEN